MVSESAENTLLPTKQSLCGSGFPSELGNTRGTGLSENVTTSTMKAPQAESHTEGFSGWQADLERQLSVCFFLLLILCCSSLAVIEGWGFSLYPFKSDFRLKVQDSGGLTSI